MKTKNILSLSTLSTMVLTALVAMTGCNRNEELPLVVSDVKAQFTTAIEKGAAANKATGVRDAQFVSGDQIGVYAVAYRSPGTEGVLELDGNYADNVQSIFDGTNWTNTPEIYYPSVALNFYAFAPYSSTFNPTATPSKYKFTVAADQSTAAKIYACDFMTALTENVTNSGSTPAPVAMKFYHRMAKLVVNFTFPTTYQGKDVKKVSKVAFHGFKNVAEIDFTTKYTYQVDGTATGGTYPKPAIVDASSTVVTISPNLAEGNPETPGTALQYEAIIVPQTQTKDNGFIEIEFEYTDGKKETFFYKEPTTNISFVAARATQINLSFQPDNKIVLGDVTIKGWDVLPPESGNVTEKEVFNTFNCTTSTPTAYKIEKVEMTVTQGTGAATSTVYTIKANHTAGQANLSFSFDGTCPSPEYYPFKIASIKLFGAGVGEERVWTLTTAKEITATGDIAITE